MKKRYLVITIMLLVFIYLTQSNVLTSHEYIPTSLTIRNVQCLNHLIPSIKNSTLVFSNKALEQAVRHFLNKPYETLFKSDILPISKLTINNNTFILNNTAYKISDFKLADLLNFSYLQELTMKNCSIDNIELNNLLYLKKLELNNISHKTITLNKLIQKLAVINCNISNTNFLTSLPFLKELYLEKNNLTEIGKLDNPNNLIKLNLKDNKIENTKELDKFTQLKELNLQSNNIKYINLSSLVNLTEVNLSGNHLTELEISNLNLIKLDLSFNNISYASFNKLTSLKWLNLNNNKLKDINFLINLKNITQLGLANNHITNFEVLNELEAVEIMNIKNNK